MFQVFLMFLFFILCDENMQLNTMFHKNNFNKIRAEQRREHIFKSKHGRFPRTTTLTNAVEGSY